MAVARLALALVVCALAIIVMVVLYRFDSLSSPVSVSVSTEACAREYVIYLGRLTPLVKSFGEEAVKAKRMSGLSAPEAIAEMQDTLTAVRSLTVPPCLSSAHSFLLVAWNEEIEYHIAEFQGKPQDAIDAHKKKSEDAIAEFSKLLAVAIGSTPTPESK